MSLHLDNINTLIELIDSGNKLALAPDYSGCAMKAVRYLINHKVRDLHLVGVPSIGFQGDMLIGSGCVSTVETAAVTIGEYGLAPRFTDAIKKGAVNIIDGTCPAIHAGLQAAEKGIPYMPVRGIIGSDLLKKREDWIIGNNPFDKEDSPLVMVKAIAPDVTLIHAPLADREGNVWIGVRREMMVMAHASKTTLVTYENLYEGNLLNDTNMAAGTISSLYISALALAKNGAWPVGLFGTYPADDEHLRLYIDMARTEDGFQNYLSRYVMDKDIKE